jgi:integrase
MAREVRQPGVYERGSHFFVRIRQRVDGKIEDVARCRYPFVSGREAVPLKLDHPLRRENALALANAYALHEHHRLKTPQREGGGREAQGTLIEWLLRYQEEALNLCAYIDENGLLRNLVPRASADHDMGQIRTLQTMAVADKRLLSMLRRQVSELDKDDFLYLLSRWHGGKAMTSTQRRLLTTFSSAWGHHADCHSMTLEKPWKGIKLQRGAARPIEERVLTESQLQKIEEEIKRLQPCTRAAIRFIRWTGARRAEAARLRWEDIRWPSLKGALPSAHFKRTKAARGAYKERITFIEFGAVEALYSMALGREMPEVQRTRMLKEHDYSGAKHDFPSEGWVFPASKDSSQPIRGDVIYTGFVRCLTHAGVAKAGPHILRHTRATALSARSDLSQGQAMEQLGHTDAKTFEIYRHMAEATGRLLRGVDGNLVNADDLRNEQAIIGAIQSLPLKRRHAIAAALMNMGSVNLPTPKPAKKVAVKKKSSAKRPRETASRTK